MFFGKPDSLEKHLPEATKAALREASAGGPSLLQQFSMLSAQMNTPQTHFQFFESGSTRLVMEDSRTLSKKHSYVFTLSACGTTPNTHFTLTAVPAAQASGRAFCGNESGALRSSEDGQAASCLDRGTPLQ